MVRAQGLIARSAALIALTCTVGLACPPRVLASGPWSVQQSPHPKTRADTTLYDVSCRSRNWCVAVGGALRSRGQLFSERWNGQAWALLHPPLPSHASASYLYGISCVSAHMCVAVGAVVRTGHTAPVAERWNGTRWTVSVLSQPRRAVDAELDGVSCVSVRSCFAVGTWSDSGGDQQAFVEQLQATHWSMRLLSGPGTRSGVTGLDGVSCTSSMVCTTVGWDDAGDGIALRWNAGRWGFQFDSNPNLWAGSALYSVSCVSATMCAAAGGGNDSNSGGAVSNAGVAETWNGVKWTVREDTDPTSTFNYDLFAVSCASRTACLAVGFIAERWNGRTWTLEHIPDPIALLGVSCPTPTMCVAVGNSTPHRGPVAPVVMRWSGHSRGNLAPIHGACGVPRPCSRTGSARSDGSARYIRRRDPTAPVAAERRRTKSGSI